MHPLTEHKRTDWPIFSHKFELIDLKINKLFSIHIVADYFMEENLYQNEQSIQVS